jgi:hypothetical protein
MPQRVLRWVNRQRELYDIGPSIDTLPEGLGCESWWCPIAEALSHGDIKAQSIHSDTELYNLRRLRSNEPALVARIEHPKYVQEFVERVDRRTLARA